MKRLIAKTLSIDIDTELAKPADEHPLIREDKTEMLVSLAQSDVNHIVEFDAPNGDIVRLEYQHTYNRRSTETKTVTTEQRPDIQITITKPDGFVLTYLYDAKYRVQDDKKSQEEDMDIDIADFPLPDAINQMHRYRDAIYYSMKAEERPEAKEIIGGYILFPGRTFGDAIENRYFYKSIAQVNIGAFPLLPAEEGVDGLIQCDLLEKHLQDILLNNTAYEQIKDSIPQKGLQYNHAIHNQTELVIVNQAKEHKRTRMIDQQICYAPAAFEKGSLRLIPGYETTKYALLHNGTKGDLFELKDTGVRIAPKAELSNKLAIDPSELTHEYYLIFDLKSKTPCATDIFVPKFGALTSAPHFVKYSSLGIS